MIIAGIVLSICLLGAWVYCILGIVASLRHSHQRFVLRRPELPLISVLKPLAGYERSLEANLKSFFEQDYPSFELIFAVRAEDDPAVPVVEHLHDRYPDIRSRLLITGDAPYPNAKVFSLSHMTAAASYDWLVMSDSDVNVPRNFLRKLSLELASPDYDLATCPYRAVPGNNIWSLLEVLGLNTEFWSAALVAKLVEGVRFTVGPTVVAHRKVFDKIPWESLSSYLAEDFVLGLRAADQGFRVDLSRVIVEHHLSDESFAENVSHRLRWARSTRRSRPKGYVGQLFTHPIPIALLLLVVDDRLWVPLVVSLMLRAGMVYATGYKLLHDKLSLIYAWLIPVQDVLSFIFWILGFTGNSIAWRGRKYRVNRDGTFDPIS
ncbi:MAG TPA: glycosyltransferase [Bryobacteraceae bacterium]|nr:glycosyltransferase [Bryobacteraceae bacterium]